MKISEALWEAACALGSASYNIPITFCCHAIRQAIADKEKTIAWDNNSDAELFFIVLFKPIRTKRFAWMGSGGIRTNSGQQNRFFALLLAREIALSEGV